MRMISFQGLTILLTLFCGLLFTKDLSPTIQLVSLEFAFQDEVSEKPNLKIPKTFNLFVLTFFSESFFPNNKEDTFANHEITLLPFTKKLLNPNYISLPPPIQT